MSSIGGIVTPEELDKVLNPWLYTGKPAAPPLQPRPGLIDTPPPGVVARSPADLTTQVRVDPPQLRTSASAATEIREALGKAVTDLELPTRVAISAMRDEFTGGDTLDRVFTEWLGYWHSLGERLDLAGTRLNETAQAWITTEQANDNLFGGG